MSFYNFWNIPGRCGKFIVWIKLHVVDHEYSIRVSYHVAVFLYYKSSIHSSFHLECFVGMGVIPKCSCLRQVKSILESLTRCYWFLSSVCSVHGCGETQSMPVNSSRFCQVVGNADNQCVAHISPQSRTRQLFIESPRLHCFSWSYFPVKFTCFKIVFNYVCLLFHFFDFIQ